MENKIINCNGIEISNQSKISLIAGPCQLESEQHAMDIAGKKLSIKHIDGPLGVRGRNSDNTLYEERLGWRVSESLRLGMEKTYPWIEDQVKRHGKDLSL